jgi:hypothetical protein
MIWDMRRLILLSLATFLFSCAVEAQTSNSLIRPGDILIVKILPPPLIVGKRALRESWVSRTVVVKSDGTMTPPRVEGLGPVEDISVESLSLVDAAQRLLEKYDAFRVLVRDARVKRVNVVIERRTFGQLLSQ